VIYSIGSKCFCGRSKRFGFDGDCEILSVLENHEKPTGDHGGDHLLLNFGGSGVLLGRWFIWERETRQVPVLERKADFGRLE
jgi:hypothetical protein